jgi:hypothetical protein
VAACEDSDGCCPLGCNAYSDADCSPDCGNGVIEEGETCDPPESCPEDRRECYAEWRRVEIRPVLSESLRRGDWSRTLEAIRRSAEGLEIASGTQKR